MMSGEKILIVDDDRTTGKVIELQLNKMGYSVVGVARSGAEAVASASGRKPDLVLMDINLGHGMDGIDAAEAIAREHNIPVVFVTAYADELTLERAKKTLPYGYINKPIRPTDLRTTISIALERASTQRRLDARRGAAPDTTVIWKVQFACNQAGAVIRFSDQGRKMIVEAGFQGIDDLLPEDHAVHIANSLRHDRPQLITGKLGNRVYSWEYRPTNKGKSVRVTVTDVTEHAQLIDHNVQQASLSEALDLLGTGIIFINENLKVFYTNKSAQRALKAGTDLKLRDGFLSCRTPDKTAELQRMVLQETGSTISLERGPDEQPLRLLVTPMHSHNENYGQNLPIAMIYVFDTARNPQPIEEIIRSLYNLSPAEARIAARLVLNPDLHMVATSMEITYNTARTHVKRIYAKTGINRLSSLVHMIVTGPVGLLIHSGE